MVSVVSYADSLHVQVNGTNVESCCHDDAVTILKNAGDNVFLTLKYFEPASGFLSLRGMTHHQYHPSDRRAGGVRRI